MTHKPIADLLKTEITPAELDVHIAKIEFEYTMLAMGVTIPVDTKSAGENLYYLRLLREALRKCK
jgi:hypothetical protein